MRAFLLSVALLLAGFRNKFAPAALHTGLRGLAVRANPPEVPPGQTATLDTLVTEEPPDDGGTISYDWRICEEAPVLGEGNINPDCVTLLDAGVVTAPISDLPTAQVTMPSVAPTTLGLPDASDGFYLPVIVRVGLGNENIIVAYRLRYGLGKALGVPVPPNNNPAIASVEQVANKLTNEPDAGVGQSTTVVLDPAGMPTVHAADTVSLRVTFAPGSAETYPILSAENQITTTTETLSVRWYTPVGQFDNPITGEPFPVTNWTFDKYATNIPAEGEIVPVYIVARDERGGVDFTVRHFLLMP